MVHIIILINQSVMRSMYLVYTMILMVFDCYQRTCKEASELVVSTSVYININIDGWLRMGLLSPPLGNFADISYLVEN